MSTAEHTPSKRLLVVTGPTASGKSELALALAQELGGEIINGDSVQLYRGFDIGSSKPKLEAQKSAPHHLYSVIEPERRCDAWQFIEMAQRCIDSVLEAGKLPIVCGGTGLYIRSLLCGLVEHEHPPEEVQAQFERVSLELRTASESEFDYWQRMHEWLESIDPLSAARIAPADLVRIKRAALYMLSTGKSIAALRDAHAHGTRRYDALALCMMPERERLYARIDARVQQMLSEGLLEEVAALLAKHGRECHPFGAIGYREAVSHLQGVLGFDEMVEQIQRNTRRFAKRQFTWWHNQPKKMGWRTEHPGEIAVPAQGASQELIGIVSGFCGRSAPGGAEISVLTVRPA